MRERQAAAQLHLLQDAEPSETALGLGGVEEGVHRRQRLGHRVGDGHGHQVAVAPHLHEQRLAPGVEQEAFEVARVGLVHAAVGVARAEVALVEREVLVRVARRAVLDGQVRVAGEVPPIGAARAKALADDAHGHAGRARGAARAVHVLAGAAEAASDQLVVDRARLRVVGVRVDVDGLARVQVAARADRSLVQLDALPGHDESMLAEPPRATRRSPGARREGATERSAGSTARDRTADGSSQSGEDGLPDGDTDRQAR